MALRQEKKKPNTKEETETRSSRATTIDTNNTSKFYPGTIRIRDPGARHHIEAIKNSEDIRLYLQNPNGVLNTDGKLDNRRAYLALREWQADIIALPETNKNWELEWL